MGHIGRFRSTEIANLKRNDSVVCRTQRGVEIGTVLGDASLGSKTSKDRSTESNIDIADGVVLRRMTTEDELLWEQLRRLGEAAQTECVRWLTENAPEVVLLEVEPMLDGRTLYFSFLSDVDSEIVEYVDRLAEIYAEQVSSSQFAKLLEHGCGPGCGTAEAKNGCGTSGGCAVCKIAGTCKTGS